MESIEYLMNMDEHCFEGEVVHGKRDGCHVANNQD